MNLEDNLFGDITFEEFHGDNIKKISSNVFNKTSEKVKYFYCYNCSLENGTNYNMDIIFSQMVNLKNLEIKLNITELPSFGQKLEIIDIKANELRIKPGAIKNLKDLKLIRFEGVSIDRIEKDAFKNTNVNNSLTISFTNCKITNGTFQNGSFDGIRHVDIGFFHSNISVLPERAFKSVLANENNTISLFYEMYYPKLDCDDCNNLWLVKGNKQKQILNAQCKGKNNNLFDDEIIIKLSEKCI